MGLFGLGSSPFDADVETVTSEMNTNEDWGKIMSICDRMQTTPTGTKDALKAIIKRLHHKVPHVAMQSLTLLDACVCNGGIKFHLEIASRDFVNEVKTIVGGKAHPKVCHRIRLLIKKWSENEFKDNPALSLIPSLYKSWVSEGYDFSPLEPAKVRVLVKDPNVVQSQQEEDDIAQAIALSLNSESKTDEPSAASTSLYPSFSLSPDKAGARPEGRKVRALYDFEAVEDNELTFSAGDIITIIDDSVTDWWKGYTSSDQGLLPSSFVTSDLSADPVETVSKVSVMSEDLSPKEVSVQEIDEQKIDQCLSLLQNADPTGETNPDPPNMVPLEEHCKATTPLIDQELEKIDRKLIDLNELNDRVRSALQMYHSLMQEPPPQSMQFGFVNGYGSGSPTLSSNSQPQQYHSMMSSVQLPPSAIPAVPRFPVQAVVQPQNNPQPGGPQSMPFMPVQHVAPPPHSVAMPQDPNVIVNAQGVLHTPQQG